MQNRYYIVEVKSNHKNFFEEINLMAFEKFECSGVQEYSYSEDVVDQVLDKDAYCWSNIRDELIGKMDQYNEQGVLSFSYFFSGTNSKSLSLKFHEALLDKYPVIDCRHLESDVKDWDALWRENYQPIIISDQLKIIPSWMKKAEQEGIYIYPGQGFGTGAHETTYLCLKLFDENKTEFLNKKIKCLDLGCGSGILGIAVLKMLQSEVTFCDVDKGALDNTVQNLSINFQEESLSGSSIVARSRLDANARYNIVFANILINVLEQEAKFIMASLESEGILILSGILVDQVDDIMKAYDRLSFVSRLDKNGWTALLFVKR